MPLTLRLPASVAPAIAPVPHPAVQRPQIQGVSGISAQDPPRSSNKELIPAAASANVRTQTRWFFISLYIYPQHNLHIHPPRHPFSNSYIHLLTSQLIYLPMYLPIYLTICIPSSQLHHPLPTYPILMAHLLFYRVKICSPR